MPVFFLRAPARRGRRRRSFFSKRKAALTVDRTLAKLALSAELEAIATAAVDRTLSKIALTAAINHGGATLTVDRTLSKLTLSAAVKNVAGLTVDRTLSKLVLSAAIEPVASIAGTAVLKKQVLSAVVQSSAERTLTATLALKKMLLTASIDDGIPDPPAADRFLVPLLEPLLTPLQARPMGETP